MKKKRIVVLITGAGAPGTAGTVFSLRNNPDNRAVTVVGTDIRPRTAGNFLTDVFHRLPSPEESAYLPRMTEIVQGEAVDVIVPQTTREVELLSTQKKKFSDMGVGVVASDAQAVTTANDK